MCTTYKCKVTKNRVFIMTDENETNIYLGSICYDYKNLKVPKNPQFYDQLLLGP